MGLGVPEAAGSRPGQKQDTVGYNSDSGGHHASQWDKKINMAISEWFLIGVQVIFLVHPKWALLWSLGVTSELAGAMRPDVWVMKGWGAQSC